VKPTKCKCNQEYVPELFTELWETFFIPSHDNCGTTIKVYADMCTEIEHWSHREDGEHDVVTDLCHYCALKLKLYVPHIVEYDKGVKWYEAK